MQQVYLDDLKDIDDNPAVYFNKGVDSEAGPYLRHSPKAASIFTKSKKKKCCKKCCRNFRCFLCIFAISMIFFGVAIVGWALFIQRFHIDLSVITDNSSARPPIPLA